MGAAAYDIPVNFVVLAGSEEDAAKALVGLLVKQGISGETMPLHIFPTDCDFWNRPEGDAWLDCWELMSHDADKVPRPKDS